MTRASGPPDSQTRLTVSKGWSAAREGEADDGLVDALSRPLASALLLLSAFVAVIVFLPPEGRLMAPLHLAVAALLGRAAFMLPLSLAIGGVLLAVHELRPDVQLPRRRLVGIGLIALAVIPIEHLLPGAAEGTGLLGEWLTGGLRDLFGTGVMVFGLVVLLGLGTLLAFEVKFRTRPGWPDPDPDAAR